MIGEEQGVKDDHPRPGETLSRSEYILRRNGGPPSRTASPSSVKGRGPGLGGRDRQRREFGPYKGLETLPFPVRVWKGQVSPRPSPSTPDVSFTLLRPRRHPPSVEETPVEGKRVLGSDS